jgi:hypothetical protein
MIDGGDDYIYIYKYLYTSIRPRLYLETRKRVGKRLHFQSGVAQIRL